MIGVLGMSRLIDHRAAIRATILAAEEAGYSVDVVNPCCGCSRMGLVISGKDGIEHLIHGDEDAVNG